MLSIPIGFFVLAQLMDSYNGIFGAVFMVLLILFGSDFVVNLLLSVSRDSFDEANRWELAKKEYRFRKMMAAINGDGDTSTKKQVNAVLSALTGGLASRSAQTIQVTQQPGVTISDPPPAPISLAYGSSRQLGIVRQPSYGAVPTSFIAPLSTADGDELPDLDAANMSQRDIVDALVSRFSPQHRDAVLARCLSAQEEELVTERLAAAMAAEDAEVESRMSAVPVPGTGETATTDPNQSITASGDVPATPSAVTPEPPRSLAQRVGAALCSAVDRVWSPIVRMLRPITGPFAHSNTFDILALLCVLLNMAVLAWNHYGMSDSEAINIERITFFLTVFFIVEMVIRVTGLGFKAYWRCVLTRLHALCV